MMDSRRDSRTGQGMGSAEAASEVALSVVVTCFNLGAYLREALESIPTACEVIVVDDGSDDPATIAVLDGLNGDRCRVIRQSNSGLGNARNRGISAARGRYIVPLDADNRLRATMVDQVVGVLDQEPDVDIVYGDAQCFGESDRKWDMGDFDFAKLIERNRIDACAGFRKALWERVGGYDEGMPVMGYEDWDFWLRCSVSGATFRYVRETLFDYRVRGGSMLSNTMRNRNQLVEHIFSKRELCFLKPLRESLIACQEQQAQRRPLTGRTLMRLAWQRLWQRLRGNAAPPATYWPEG